MIQGNPYKIDDLKEFLAVTFRENQAQEKNNKSATHEMKGFANVRNCAHCGKTGHSKESCWKLERGNFNTSKDKNKPRKHSNIQCWNCGREGHIRRDCHKKWQNRLVKESNPGIAAAANRIEEDICMPTYVDSACSEHLVKDLNLLTEVINIKSERKSMKAADRTLIPLTHKGMRIMHTKEGPLLLSEVY